MKKSILTIGLMMSMALVANAQGAPTFSAAEQKKIQQILGSDYEAVFSSKGELAIATKASVGQVKALPGGGFTNTKPSAASNVLIHKGYVLATSEEALKSMRSKLGAERMKQLEAVIAKK